LPGVASISARIPRYFNWCGKEDLMIVGRISLALLLLSGALARSQGHPATESQFRRYEIYGGAAFTGSNPSGATFGGGFGGGGNFTRWAGVLGEFTLVRGSCCVVNNITVTDYLVGPRIAKPFSAASHVSPFADFLFGGQTLNNSSNHHAWAYGNGSGPAIAADGGLDLRLTSRLMLRGQGGFVHSQFVTFGGFPAVWNDRWRAATYVAYRF
jgi:hypothetical protein